MNNEKTDFEPLAEMIKDIKFAMLTTVTENGCLHSRPMGTLELKPSEFDGTLWFFSRKDSFKNHQIENDQHVNLAYANPDKQRYVSVSGKAFITQDRERMEKLWNPLFKAWFPEGLNDPELSLIGVKVDSAELWDSPPGKVVQLLGFVKSAITGKPYDHSSQNKHVEIKQ